MTERYFLDAEFLCKCGRPECYARRVPDAAELELIRNIQEDIYRRTKAADITDLGDAQTTVLRRLSDEQGKLAELLKGLIERMK